MLKPEIYLRRKWSGEISSNGGRKCVVTAGERCEQCSQSREGRDQCFQELCLGDERMIIDQGPLRWKWVLAGSELWLWRDGAHGNDTAAAETGPKVRKD